MSRNEVQRVSEVARAIGVNIDRESVEACTESSVHGKVAEKEKNSTDPERRIMSRLASYFDSLSLSTFTKTFATQWIRKNAGDPACKRVFAFLLNQVNGRRGDIGDLSEWQRRCPQLIPHVRSCPVWDRHSFDWIERVEAQSPVILKELLSLRDDSGRRHVSGFQPYRSPKWSSSVTSSSPDSKQRGRPAHSSGEWNVYYLHLHNVDFAQNRKRCPETVRILESIPGFYDHAFFSALAPQTHVAKHNGPTNKKLRVHLPLVVPPRQSPRSSDSNAVTEAPCRLRIGSEMCEMREGKCLVFDDSFEHEAWNDSSESRIVLIFDIWHPSLSAKEVKFLRYLQRAQLRSERKLAMAALKVPDADRDNLFAILEQTRSIRPRPGAVWNSSKISSERKECGDIRTSTK